MNDALFGGISREAIEAQLQRILGSQAFARSDRSKTFLQFAVAKCLAQDRGALKGDVIAIEVFQKGGKFNSSVDSTVRTGANRLRRTLRRYYESEGRNDPIIVSLPEGRYLPEFKNKFRYLDEHPAIESYQIDPKQLVGRSAEMRFLQREFQIALTGQARLACIVAEPGIGKTELVETFLKHARDDSGARIGTGRCRLQLQPGDPYQVWLDIFADLCHSNAAMSELLRATAETWWKQIYANKTGEATVFQLRREMEQFLTCYSKTGPIVLFLDDLHWADVPTIDMLNQILPCLRSAKILLVAAYRQSDMMIRESPFLSIEPELEMHGLCRRLLLSELPVRDVEAYLDAAFPGHTFPSGVAESLHQASGGNALCITDMVRHAVRKGWIRRANDVWEFSASPSIWRTELPDSVAAMAAKKLGELGERDRQLLWVSSLQGVIFDSLITSQAIGLDKHTVEDRLDHLRRTHQLLRPALAPSYPHAGDRYEFAHVLYFDALHQASSPARLAEFSKRTAEAMISAYGNTNEAAAPILGCLWEDAGETAMAVPFYLRAAQRALRLSAFRQALDLVEHVSGMLAQTIRTAAEVGLELEALTIQSLALSALHGYEYAPLETIYRRARTLAEELGDQTASMQTGMALWSFAASGNFETALDIAKRLRIRTRGSPSAQYSANSKLACGVSLLHLGQMDLATATLAEAHNHSSRNRSRSLLPSVVVDPEVSILCNWARALWFRGRQDQALRVAERARDIARELRHPKTNAYAAAVLADIYHLRRDTAKTLTYTEEALKIAHEFELGHEIVWASGFRAWAFTERGETKEGCELERPLRAYCGPCRPKFWSHCAWAHGVDGNPEKGLKILAEAFRSAQERRETYYDAEMLRLEGELMLMQNTDGSSNVQALTRFQKAVSVSRGQKSLSLELRALSSSLRLLLLSDARSVPHAAATLSRVVGRFHEGLDTPDLIQAKGLLAQAGYSSTAETCM